METSITSNSNKMTKVTMLNGYWFYFEVDGNQVAVHGSAFSGKETVYFNDEPVSEKRAALSVKSVHHFSVNGNSYQVIFTVTSLIRGEVRCELLKNDMSMGVRTKAFIEPEMNLWGFLLTLGGLFLLGAGIGFLMAWLFV